jgi:KipI family sensor histidine kinase inhibitor
MAEAPKIKSLGDAALSIEFGDAIDPEVNARVMALFAALEAAKAEGALPGLSETVPSFRALAVHYDPLRISRDEIAAALAPYLLAAEAEARVGSTWVLPACYEGDFAPDLADVAVRAGITPDEVVALHTGADFRVYILGFVPGFAYLGGVPEAIRLPRRTDPRTAVPAGSVAIAGEMSGVYPLTSPGGWHLIGRCPVPMFDPSQDPPVFLKPGDRVRFKAIDAATCAAIETAAAAGTYDVSALRVEDN